jgi:general secretion pathway protein D
MVMSTFSRVSHAALLAFVAAVPVVAQAAPPPAPAPLPVAAPPQTGPSPAAVIVNLRDIDIADVAQQVSRITGRTIILDPAVKGTVNVVSSRPLGPDGVWQLFESVLRGQGFAVVRNGRAWRVIAQADAARQPASGSASGQMITRMIRLDKVSPEAALRVLKPLVASFGSLEMTTNPNAIIVTDYADNVARIEGLAHALDHSQGAGFDTISLHFAAAKDVAAAIQGIVGEGDNAAPHAVADGRSNTVLVRGDASILAKAREIARQLDRPGGSAAITTRVFRLHYNDAESLTAVMRGLMGGQASAQNPVAKTLATGSSGGAFGNSGLGSNGGGGGGLAGGLSGLSGGSLGSGGGLSQATGVSGIGSAAAMNPLPVMGSSSSAKSGEGGFATEELAVEPDRELNAIVVRGKASAIASIEALITQLDVRRPQVLIEAAIVEINGDWTEQLGVQMGFGGAAAGATNAVGTSFSNTGVSLGQILSYVGAPVATAFATDGLTGSFGKSGSFQVLIQALAKSTRANLLSTPSITTLDNQPAEIVVGQNVPFITGSYTTAGTTTPFTTVERADVGITMRVVPRVHEGDTVQLDVSQEVSSLAPSVAGAADLITNRRSIQTTVLADDGQTIVLGGLITNNSTRTASQVPILGSIPVIGNLFKSRIEEKVRQTLFVFLRPTILRDTDSVAAAAAAKFDRVRHAETELQNQPSLLLEPPAARLPIEINGIY